MEKISAKFGRMMDEEEFEVYPPKKDGRIILQSAHRIVLLRIEDPEHAILSKYQPEGAFPLHLSPSAGATIVTVPEHVIEAIANAAKSALDRLSEIQPDAQAKKD